MDPLPGTCSHKTGQNACPYKICLKPVSRPAILEAEKITPNIKNTYENHKRLGGEGAIFYVMSDIHGCFEKYQAMLWEIDFSPRDTLYILGDVIDRGSDGIKILQDMNKRPNVFPILGNHEFTAAVCLPWLMEEITNQSLATLDETQLAALSEWIANGGGPTLRELKGLSQQERQDILEYFQEMELYAQVEAGGRSFVLTHSGLDNFSSDKPLESYQLQDFLFGRPKPDSSYYPDKTLVFGHTPTRLLWGQDKIFRTRTMIDIDCGCVFPGGQLGCLCLDTMEEFYV